MKMRGTRALTLGVAAALMLSACASDGGDTGDDTGTDTEASGDDGTGDEGTDVAAAACNEDRPDGEVHVFVLDDAAAEAERAAAERFNADSDVEVIIDSGPTAGVEYNTAIRNTIGSGSAPDVFMSWGSAGIAPLLEAGALLPLDDMIAADPQLREAFIPSVFDEEVVDGVAYGIPMRGVAPEFVFFNQNVVDAAGVEPPSTVADFISQTDAISAEGATPVGIAGADKWPQLIWFQYIYARQVGNEAVSAGLAGDTEFWDSEGSRAALATIRELVDAGVFGQNYDSVNYGADGSAALLRTGKSAYEVQGTWHYATVADGADDVTSLLGWANFPTIEGGEGQPDELVGNLSNFYNVAADTCYPDAVAGFLAELYSDEFLNDQLGLGNLPPTTNAADLVAASDDLDDATKEWLGFVAEAVQASSTFQLSWDQVVPAERQVDFQNAIADFFNGTIDADAFVTTTQDIVAS